MALVLVLAVGAAGTVSFLQLRGAGGKGAGGSSAGPGTAAPAPPGCPAQAALPRPGAVTLQLLNGTARDGLGKGVADELAKRGFRVGKTGNAPRPDPGPAHVAYGPGAAPAARLLAAQFDGARVLPQPTAAKGSVALTLGAAYTRMRTPAEAVAWLGSPNPGGAC